MAFAVSTNDALAQRFYNDHEDSPHLNYLLCDGLLFKYNDGIYEVIDEQNVLRRAMLRFLLSLKDQTSENPISPKKSITTALIKDTIEILKLTITNKVDEMKADYIAFNDGKLLNLLSTPFTIESYNRSKIAFVKIDQPSTIMTDSNTEPTKFLEFLDQILIDHHKHKPDQQLIDFVQEMFGYCLLDNVSAEAAFFLYGSGANGKSVLLDILKAMFPPHLISASSLESLTTNAFRLGSLIGKKLNIVNEEESRYLKSDMFKNLVTGGAITVERKYLDAVTTNLYVKFIFATNNLPSFSGVDQAIRRRVKIIPFYATIPPHKRNPNLAQEIIDEELPQVILWSLKGAERLIKNQFQFSQPDSIAEITRKYEERQSSTIDFFNENFVITSDEEDVYDKGSMYYHYTLWCESVGRKPIMRRTFFQELEDRFKEDGIIFPEAPVYCKKIVKTVRAVVGVRKTQDQSAWINSNQM